MAYEQQVDTILKNADAAHRAYYGAKKFSGPSLHFHRRAIATQSAKLSERHMEYVYATLASWGMHRMGKGGPKMQSFDTFRASVEPLRKRIVEVQGFELLSMTDDSWDTVRAIFCGIKIMATNTSIVGNSKAMHHMMPNVIPPVDREYTLNFLRGNKNVTNGLDDEWALLKGIVTGFFAPVMADKTFAGTARTWMSQQTQYPWDTSILKVVDNLVVGQQHAMSR